MKRADQAVPLRPSPLARYVYDAEGRRVERVTAQGTWDAVYDLAGRVMSEYDAADTWSRGEVWAGGRHLATYHDYNWPDAALYFSSPDGLGSERLRTRTDGSLAETCTALPFGDGQACTGSDPSPLHFTAKPRDAETGLDDFGARLYSSSLGRWMTPDDGSDQDPGDPQSWNLYSYVRNNPVSNADPDGHKCIDTNRGVADDGTGGGCPDAGVAADGTISPMKITVTAGGAFMDGESGPTLYPTISGHWVVPHVPTNDGIRDDTGSLLNLALLADGAGEALDAIRGAGQLGWEEISGLVRDAASRKGNTTLGTYTREQAEQIGRAWVGPDAKLASDGKTLVSADGMRQYRPPTFKPRLGRVQANLEQRAVGSTGWLNNVHLNITN